MKANRIAYLMLFVFLAAFVLRLAVAVKQGFAHPMESDSYYYLQLAKNLAQGTGYCVGDGFWPGQPSMQRMPGWPFLISIGLRVCPWVSPDLLMRLLCILIDSLNAVLVCWLTWRLIGSSVIVAPHCVRFVKETDHRSVLQQAVPSFTLSIVAGLLYAAHPAALFLAYNGESEPLFVALCLAGFISLLRGGRWGYVASLCFGLSCLVRANYVIWIGMVGVLVSMRWIFANIFPTLESRNDNVAPLCERTANAQIANRGNITRSVVLLSLLFLLPSLLWATRNYHVCGHFPVLSTLRGQTFYGGNNPVVANTMDLWGYWIFPDSIPGEKKAAELARTMSEYDLDAYYYKQGIDYVKREWFAMPRLLLGKLVRAYIPIPWKPNILSYGVGAYRFLIYVLAAFGLVWWWLNSRADSRNDNAAPICDREPNAPITDRCYIQAKTHAFSLVFLAMILTNLAGVLIFWGCFRFAFVLEPLLIPFAAMGMFFAKTSCSTDLRSASRL